MNVFFGRFLTIIVALGMTTAMMTNCKRSPKAEDTMAFTRVEYVKEFPVEIEAKCSKVVDLGDDNIRAFSICDSLMLCSTMNSENFINVLSWPEMKPLGELIHKGNGPYEVVTNVLFFEENVRKENGDVCLYYYDQKNSIIKVNVTKSLKRNALVADIAVSEAGSNVYCFTCTDNHETIVSRIENGQKEVNRHLFIKNTLVENSVMKELNQANIKTSDVDYNTLGRHITNRKYDGRIVEACSILNLINLYSLDGSYKKSVCVGQKLDNLRDLESLTRNKRPMSRHIFIKGYDNYFAIIYCYFTRGDLHENKPMLCEIRLFDWDGVPLCRIKLDKTISTFHIDPEKGELVGMDFNGVMYFYDIDLTGIGNIDRLN